MSGAEEDLALLKTKAQAYKESNGYDEYYTQDYETALEALVLLIDSGEKLSDAHSTYSKLQFGTIQVDDPEVTKTVENLGKALQNLATCSELVDTIVDTERWQPEKQKQNIENLSNAITNFAQDFLGFVGYYS